MRTLQCINFNKPSVEGPILNLLFEACEQRAEKIVSSFSSTERRPAKFGPVVNFKLIKILAEEAKEILTWIMPGSDAPLSGERLEDYAIFLDMCNVPLLNAHMALAAAKRSKLGARIQLPRHLVILAAEEQLRPSNSWSKIARKLGISNPGSLRKAVATLRKLCRTLAIHIPEPPRKK
jgi:hypothetical protein